MALKAQSLLGSSLVFVVVSSENVNRVDIPVVSCCISFRELEMRASIYSRVNTKIAQQQKPQDMIKV